MGLKTKFTILASLLLLIIGFQNCSTSKAPIFSRSQSSTLLDSGTPYEGKIYATTGKLCPDGVEIHSRIVLSSAIQGELNRENCQEINPVKLTAKDFQIDQNTDTVIYNNQNYKSIGTGTIGITNLNISNDANNFYYGYEYEGKPSWLQVFLDTDNNPATGYYQDGIGADFMIENDNVWKYSAAAGAPQSTWAWTSLVSANKINVAPNISWSFPRSSIGSPMLIKVLAHTSLGAKSPIMTQVPK